MPPAPLSLPPDTLILTHCYADEDLPDVIASLVACMQKGMPQRSLVLNVQDTMLRLQVGADSALPSYTYDYLDISVAPGVKRCDAYLVKQRAFWCEFVIITPSE